MPMDPYANVNAPMAAKAPPAPPRGAMPKTPQELDAMLSQGFTMNPDGTLSPPAVPMPPPQFSASPMPSAGAMRMAGQPALPPPPPAEPEAFLSDPIFAAHMGIRNRNIDNGPDDSGSADYRDMGGLRIPQEPPPPVNIGVPGGASIQNGMPQSAKQPTPPAYKPTYNVTMPTSEEASQRQYMTEVQRGQNHANRRDYDEMVHQRKVNNIRGVLGRRP